MNDESVARRRMSVRAGVPDSVRRFRPYFRISEATGFQAGCEVRRMAKGKEAKKEKKKPKKDAVPKPKAK
jgi:hypothetical protein